MIQAIHAGNLMHYASYMGIRAEDIKNLLDDPQKDICDPDEWVSEDEYLSIYNFVYIKSNDEYFGLKFGTFLNIRSIGLITEISKHAANLQQCVHICDNYLKSTFAIVQLAESFHNGTYQLSLHSALSDVKLKLQVLDTVLCFMYRELATKLPKDTKIIYEIPSNNETVFEKILHCHVQKGLEHRLLMDENVLYQEFNHNRSHHIEILLPKFLALLEASNDKITFISIVKRMIYNISTPELPDIETVASCLFMSDRTLQRKLQAEGTNFRSLLNEIKQELTQYLSYDKKMKKQEIAHILGYEYASSLNHAEKKW